MNLSHLDRENKMIPAAVSLGVQRAFEIDYDRASIRPPAYERETPEGLARPTHSGERPSDPEFG